jgi:polyhydroxyalkanoate synthesis repressor PhaR
VVGVDLRQRARGDRGAKRIAQLLADDEASAGQQRAGPRARAAWAFAAACMLLCDAISGLQGDIVLVKKYGNRRLYDTDQSRYITMEELGEMIRSGAEARVVDAKSGEDLTSATLTQIITEGRGAARLLPVPLLVQLIRMGDDALAEFLGQYVTWALELYLQAKQGVQAMSPFNPFLSFPFAGGGGLSRLFGTRPPARAEPAENEIATLRRELDELKKGLKKRRR